MTASSLVARAPIDPSYAPGCGPHHARRVVRDRARPDAAARGELAAGVEEDLVHVDGGVRVRAGDRLGMEIQDARHEGADERAACRKRAVPGRGQVHEPGARLEVQDREGEGVHGAVPADDVERRGVEAEAVERPGSLHEEVADPLVHRPLPLDAVEVAVRVGRVHAELPGLVPPLRRQPDAARELEREPALRAGIRQEAVEEALRDVDVVVPGEAEIAEWRAKEAAPSNTKKRSSPSPFER